MALTSLRKLLGFAPKRQKLIRRRRPLSIDVLEDRRLLATLFVDDDLAQKHNAQYTTISAAVAAAHAGDTIRVSPGTYEESVTVDKKLTIVGSQGGTGDDQKHPTKAMKNAPIVEITGGEDGFHLTANDVVIRGFTIEDSDISEATSVGINIDRQTSGDTIEQNIIQQTTFGIYLNTSGAHRTTIQNNVIRNNNNPGSASGNGIYSDQGVSNVGIQQNYFTGNANASIILVDTGPSPATAKSNVMIKNNLVDHDSAMIFTNATNLHVVNNIISNSSGSGVFLGGGVTNTEISNNRLSNGAFTGINLRVNAFGNAPDANSNIQIVNNKISGFGDAGIRIREGSNHVVVKNNEVKQNGTAGGGLGGITLEDTGTTLNQLLNNRVESNKEAGILLHLSSGNTVSKNDVRKNAGDGISLVGGTGNTVDQNNLESNGTPASGANPATGDGIHADSASTGNTFTKNDAKKNAKFDYEDNSVGTGTAGTANTWTKNKGKTASPPGLIAK